MYNPAMPYWLGRTLGKVNIEMLLARGGMAEVYLGKHSTLQRPVVIKVLNNQYSDDPELLDRFQREARAVAILRHPNIVQVYDFDAIEGHPYITMEYVAGISLETYLRGLHGRHQLLDHAEIGRLIVALAGALQYAHERGIIHRDVKPGNIILTSPSAPVEAGKSLPPDAQPVLTDFGLVRFLNSSHQTTAGQIAGTPAYMSPEQARGEVVDARSDVYSLGIVCYEMLAGHTPFDADTVMGVMLKHMQEPPPGIPGLALPLQQVMDKALAKRREDRYQTPSDFAVAFEAARTHRTEAPTMPALDYSPAFLDDKVLPARPRWNLVSIGILAGIVVLIGGFFALRPLLSPPAGLGAPYATMVMPAGSAVPAPVDSVAVLRFQDGSSRVDEVTLSASNIPAPADGKQYEAWLVDPSGESLRSLGKFTPAVDGAGVLSFVDPQGRNLLAVYDKMQITLESDPDPSPNPSEQIVYSSALPPDGLLHVRHLLVSFPNAPKGAALVDGLLKNSILVDDAAQNMLAAYESGDEAAARHDAEIIMNVIVGAQSEDYKDWDGDGQVLDPGDGYGLLLNGDNTGYIQATYLHAGLSMAAADATANMKQHGAHVQIVTQNLQEWAPQLRDLVRRILASPFSPDTGADIRQSVALGDRMLKGEDLNGNERVEPIPGEGGAETAYQHAYYMADMVVTPLK